MLIQQSHDKGFSLHVVEVKSLTAMPSQTLFQAFSFYLRPKAFYCILCSTPVSWVDGMSAARYALKWPVEKNYYISSSASIKRGCILIKYYLIAFLLMLSSTQLYHRYTLVSSHVACCLSDEYWLFITWYYAFFTAGRHAVAINTKWFRSIINSFFISTLIKMAIINPTPKCFFIMLRARQLEVFSDGDAFDDRDEVDESRWVAEVALWSMEVAAVSLCATCLLTVCQ